VAKEENGDIFKHFLLYQMKDLRISEEYFEKDESFDLKEHLSKSFGAFQDKKPMKIKLQFSKEVKEIVEEYSFHPTQELTSNPDGTTTVTFTAGGAYEICWFLFRWGKYVKVLSPKKLKNTYKKLLENAKGQINQ
jgi:predicted DNA-binding transcriptional regulator YafY